MTDDRTRTEEAAPGLVESVPPRKGASHRGAAPQGPNAVLDPNDASTWGCFYLPLFPRWLCRVRRWVWRYVFRYECETCQTCGKPVNLVWWDDTGSWMEVVGSEGGIRCIHCFSRECWERGISLTWRPEVDHRAAIAAWGPGWSVFAKDWLDPSMDVYDEVYADPPEPKSAAPQKRSRQAERPNPKETA